MASAPTIALYAKRAHAGETMIVLAIIAGYSSSLVIETGVLDFYAFYIFILLGLGAWALEGLAMSRAHVALVGLLIAHLLVTALLALWFGREVHVLLGVRQVIAVVVIYGSLYHLLRDTNLSTKRLYELYLRCGVWFAAVGLCLFGASLAYPTLEEPIRLILPRWTVGFWGDSYPRLVSVANEPASALILLAPLVFEAVGTFLGASTRLKGRESVVVLSASALTISPLFVVAALYSLLYWSIGTVDFRKLFVGILIVIGVTYLSQHPQIVARLDFMTAVGGDFENISLYTLFNNAIVAITAFSESYFLGFGLGSHEISYGIYAIPLPEGFLELNQKDANSFFLRLLSELGLFALIPLLVFTRLLLKVRRAGGVGLSLAGSSGLILLLFLLRQGNYLQFSLVFFSCLLYLGYLHLRRRSSTI